MTLNVAGRELLSENSSGGRDTTPSSPVRSTGQGSQAVTGQAESSSRTTLVWILLALSVACRAAVLFLLKPDAAYVLVPRSFVGGGFQSTPALLDLALPILIVCALWRGRGAYGGTRSRLARTIADSLCLLLFSLAVGFSLFAYESQWESASNLTLTGLLRWLQFVTSYLAWNMLLDELQGKWQRLVAIPALVLSLGVLQDAFPGMPSPALTLLMSVGWTLTWTVLALRRHYRRSPLAASFGAATVGAISCLLIVMRPSNSLFPPMLLLLAFPIGAITLHSSRWWARWVALASITALGLGLSLVVPRFVPLIAADLVSRELPPAHVEQVEGITVSYDDIRVRDVAVRLAHVLAAANQLSQEVYGVSPQVDHLSIPGIHPGGFHADFPNKIEGNLVSPRQIELLLDPSFLNDPAASVDVPDPVNAILHEYSHLYGIVPYQPWMMGRENEGWATFAATRLSQRLYERRGASLWSPAYNYAARAEAITNTNLAGRAVHWSHPDEYVGFRLWYRLSQRDGDVSVFRKRWAMTLRKFDWWLQRSEPAAARRVADAFGRAEFAAFGSATPVRYGQIYTLQDAVSAEEALGLTAEEATARYKRKADEVIDPGVRVPVRTPGLLDIGLSISLLILCIPLAFLRRRMDHPVPIESES